MELSKRHMRFLLVNQCAIPVVINFFANGLISWLINRSATTVPLWGSSGVGVDLLATSILLPFLLCVLNSPNIGKQMRAGKVQALPQGQLPISSWFRRPTWQRGLFLALMGLIFAGIPVVWALTIGNVEFLPVKSLVLFKAGWSALLAALISPVVGWWALARASVDAYQKIYEEEGLRT